jgi:hypothetical protein
MIWVPIAFIGLGLLAWAVLSGLPFGRNEPSMERRAQPEMEVVDEREAPASATIGEIRGPVEDVAPPPIQAPAAEPPPVVRVVPQPSQAVQTDDTPSPQPRERTGEISESDAMSTLRGFITSRQDYGVSADCLVISSQGYRNVGYTLQAYDRCGESSLGQWRVDSKTREVFRRRGDGRYLRP